MCGRYTLHHSVEEIAARFNVANVAFEAEPRYNIAPTQTIAAITGDGERNLRGFGWGLVPFWAKDPQIGNRMINARAETIAEKPAYKHALARRRCLIPADGFYEWMRTGAQRTPMYIRFRDERLFAFAGIWERWSDPAGADLYTCSIVTVEPNHIVAPIHNRMPAILAPEDEEAWLEPTRGAGDVLPLLRPHPPDEMEAFPVSRRVNSPSFDDPACTDAAEE
jgi:putative SOS response-associated peptidase YedK